MNSVRRGLAIVVLSLGIAGLIVGPAASQTERNGEKEGKPKELWRLYPLDPEVGREGRTQSDVSVTPPSLAPARELNGLSDVAPEDAGSPSAWPWLTAVTLASAGALAIVAVRRNRRPGSFTQVAIQDIQTDSGAPPDFEPGPPDVEEDPSLEMPLELSRVRIHLRDGGMMEGAVKHAPTRDSPVMLLDVVGVSDAEGKKRDPEPFDEFVPLVEIEHIESIEHNGKRTPDPRRHR